MKQPGEAPMDIAHSATGEPEEAPPVLTHTEIVNLLEKSPDQYRLELLACSKSWSGARLYLVRIGDPSERYLLAHSLNTQQEVRDALTSLERLFTDEKLTDCVRHAQSILVRMPSGSKPQLMLLDPKPDTDFVDPLLELEARSLRHALGRRSGEGRRARQRSS